MQHGVVGIDPGANGGIAYVIYDKAEAYKMPETPADIVAVLKDLQHRSFPSLYIEKQWARPALSGNGKKSQGAASSWKFAQHYGTLLGILATLQWKVHEVAPLTWQNHLNCRTGGDKKVTKEKAQELFPDIRVTHAIADALLIAEYGRRIGHKK